MSTNADTQISKAELLDNMRAERARWDALLERVGVDRMGLPGVDGDWSVKDIVAHVAAYEQWTSEQIVSAVTGEPPPPVQDDAEHQADWLDLHRRNARIYILNRDLPLDEIMATSHRAFEQMIEAVGMLSEQGLAGTQEWTFGEPVKKMIPVQTYVHYRDHMPMISEWLDKQEAG
jgi:hypothetical protein